VDPPVYFHWRAVTETASIIFLRAATLELFSASVSKNNDGVIYVPHHIPWCTYIF
jgi:hypothetical protein